MTLLAASDTMGRGVVIDLLIILAAAAVVTMILRRLRLATIAGYLITGAIIGPTALGLVTDVESIELISQLAIILLMFGIGLHLDTGALGGGMVSIIGVGAVSTLGTVLLGWPLTMAFGLSAPVGLAVAIALAMSSTAVVLRIFQQRRELRGIKGRLCLGILLVQDMFALVGLMALPPLAVWAGTPVSGVVETVREEVASPDLGRLALTGVLGVGGIVALVAVGRLVIPRLLREASQDTSEEVMLVLAGAIALGAAVLTSLLGFSPELGAFLSGFLLAMTPFRHQLSGQLAPMRDLFMAIFFTAVGLEINLVTVAEGWWVILLGTAALLVVKTLMIAGAAWAAGATGPVAFATGASLAQAGEFSLIILGAAVSQNILGEVAHGRAIAIIVLSLILTPLLIDAGGRWSSWASGLPLAGWVKGQALRPPPPALPPPDEADTQPESDGAPAIGDEGLILARHVIIGGFGVVGRALADRLEVIGVPFTVIELNTNTVERQTRLGRSIVYGDISNPDVLESAGIDKTDAVLLTVPDDEATLRACRVIRARSPDAFIAARTNYLSKAMRAAELGADHVTVEEIATAEAMERQVLAKLVQRAKLKRAQGGVGVKETSPER